MHCSSELVASIIHVPRADQPALFSSIRHWLRPGGYFLASLMSGDLPAGWENNWLDAGPMFWSGYDADTNRRLLTDTGFDLIKATVLPQMEGDEEVRFQWITARAAVALRNSASTQPGTTPAAAHSQQCELDPIDALQLLSRPSASDRFLREAGSR